MKPLNKPAPNLPGRAKNILSILDGVCNGTAGSAAKIIRELITKVEELQELQVRATFVKKRFKDLPVGARFKYPDGEDVWAAVEVYGRGSIARWNGLENSKWQSRCCFVDDDWSLESEVEVIL